LNKKQSKYPSPNPNLKRSYYLSPKPKKRKRPKQLRKITKQLLQKRIKLLKKNRRLRKNAQFSTQPVLVLVSATNNILFTKM
jgi:transcriptional regulator of met regulon